MLAALKPGRGATFTRQPAGDSIRDALAAALRARGHEVHVNVGRAQFRCDLGIVDDSKQGYALAVLLDNPADAVPDTAERYVFRPGILRAFGWRVIDLPGKDWLDGAPGVLSRIEAMLAHGEDRALDVEIAPPAAAAEPAPPPVDVPAPRTAPDGDTTAEVARSLRFEQGCSRKFWRAGVRGDELSVTYGRIGSTGQVNLKQFDSKERALREMEKLVGEKLRKGYVED
nr:WGR domain-containing protein [Massilia glaciei]